MTYFTFNKLETYILAKELGNISWNIFTTLSWEHKKIMGFQFAESTDSIAANIAEGCGRFHYLDKRKFYFNARGSLFESRHWFDTMVDRKLINGINQQHYIEVYNNLQPSLNGLIRSIPLK